MADVETRIEAQVEKREKQKAQPLRRTSRTMHQSETTSPWKSVLQYIPVAVQTAAMCFIIFTTSRVPANLIVIALLILSAGLLAWSVRSIGSRRFNMSPQPHERARLCTVGPYRFVRHPMYLAVLTFMLVLVLFDFGWARLIAWGVLFVNMTIKMAWEERILSRSLPGYAEYTAYTKRLIPFVY